MCYTNIVFNQRITRNVDRDALEHQRLDDRVGFQTRFQTAGNLIFKPQTQSSLVVNDKQRFNKDHAVNDQLKRQRDREKEDRFYEARLQKRFQNESKRWEQQQRNDQRQQQIIEKHKKVQAQNNRNSNRLGYNPITLAYEQNNKGNKLKQHDEKKDINRFARSKNITQKNARNFNIITGQQAKPLQATIPEKYKERVEAKYQEKLERQKVKYQPQRDKYDYLDDEP